MNALSDFSRPHTTSFTLLCVLVRLWTLCVPSVDASKSLYWHCKIALLTLQNCLSSSSLPLPPSLSLSLSLSLSPRSSIPFEIRFHRIRHHCPFGLAKQNKNQQQQQQHVRAWNLKLIPTYTFPVPYASAVVAPADIPTITSGITAQNDNQHTKLQTWEALTDSLLTRKACRLRRDQRGEGKRNKSENKLTFHGKKRMSTVTGLWRDYEDTWRAV